MPSIDANEIKTTDDSEKLGELGECVSVCFKFYVHCTMPCLVVRECTIFCGRLCVHAVAKPTHASKQKCGIHSTVWRRERANKRKTDKIAMLLVNNKTNHFLSPRFAVCNLCNIRKSHFLLHSILIIMKISCSSKLSNVEW